MTQEAEWTDEVWQIDQAIEDAKRANRLDSQIARLTWLRDNIDELVQSRGKVAMAEAALDIATARLTVLAGETRALGAALEQIRDYEPMDIEGDHFAFAKMQRLARAALGAERA